MKTTNNIKLVRHLRREERNENHHLFLQTPGRKVWWIGLTFRDGLETFRIRKSLETHKVQLARIRRDAILKDCEAKFGLRVHDAEFGETVRGNTHATS